MKTEFSIRLKKRRRALNLTMIELGDACGLTHGCISQYESGLREPSYDTLLNLSSILRVTVDYLVGRSEYGMDDLLSDDRMFALLEGFMYLSYDKRHMLFTFFQALQVFDKEKKEKMKEKIKMTEHGIPEQVRHKISGNGSLI